MFVFKRFLFVRVYFNIVIAIIIMSFSASCYHGHNERKTSSTFELHLFVFHIALIIE